MGYITLPIEDLVVLSLGRDRIEQSIVSAEACAEKECQLDLKLKN
jgi:hypothetical protein